MNIIIIIKKNQINELKKANSLYLKIIKKIRNSYENKNENNGPRGELPIPVNDENAEIMESRNEFDDYDIIEE